MSLDPQDIARAMELLEANSEPQRFVYVTSVRVARTVLLMPGLKIHQAKKQPVFHRGMWVKILERIPQ